MSEHQRNTTFLRQVILYDDTAECHKLEERIAQDQRDERCVRRAICLVALLTALAVAGLSYAAIFLPDFPEKNSHFIIKISAVLGLASLICLPAFLGYWGAYRRKSGRSREECRRLATRLLETRLGKPGATSLTAVAKERETARQDSGAAGAMTTI